MTSETRVRQAVVRAALAAAGSIAFQVAGKAARDALFLDVFPIEALPSMMIVSSGVSLALVGVATRAISRLGPTRVVPSLYGMSAGLLVVEWLVLAQAPRSAAVVIYLHFAALGALLVSGLWSILSEQFDPRTAKRQISWINAAATSGGIAGGLLAWQISVSAILPMLAAVHAVSGAIVFDLARGARPARAAAAAVTPEDPARSGFGVLIRSPYLRSLVAFVLITTIAEGLLDYVFKARVDAGFASREDLRRFFALFYAGLGMLTAVVLAIASRPALQRLGLARTIATMPAVVAIGGAGALIAPGLASVTFARAGEVIMRNSLARSAYELFFVPVAAADKRATKTLIDVGVVRLGDAAGGAIVQGALALLAAQVVGPVLLVGTLMLGLAALALTRRLHRGYFTTLERSLLARADQAELAQMEEALTRTAMLHSVGDLGLTRHDLGSAAEYALRDAGARTVPTEVVVPQEPGRSADPELVRLTELRSTDAARVRSALTAGPLSPTATSQAITLLAWDEVARDAITALRQVADRVVGQLIDRLLDPDEEFAVRRRLPLVLATCRDERAVSGLLRALDDRRFEVRYRAGRALSRIVELGHGGSIERHRVIRAVLGELTVDRAVWESQRLLDRGEDDAWSPVLDDVLRERASRSLEHVFTMLALILPREPLRVAFRGLHTDDPILRGTALEYLEHALPTDVKEPLWPLLDDTGARARARPSQEVLADLLRSNLSITLNLEAKRRLRG